MSENTTAASQQQQQQQQQQPAPPPAAEAQHMSPEKIAELKEAALKKYENDWATQKKSGIWELKEEHRQANKKVFAGCQDVFPFDDVHKLSDCDLIYRFLIGKKFDVKTTVEALHEAMKLRKELKLNTIIWERFDPMLEKLIKFHCCDKEGRPVYIWRPDPYFVTELIEKFDRETIIRYYCKVFEQGRRCCLAAGAERMSCITDFSQLGMGVLRNLKAVGLLKEIAGFIQKNYVECQFKNFCVNTGWVFSSLYGMLKLVLDERVQAKFLNAGSGTDAEKALAEFLDLNEVPKSYCGKGPEQSDTVFRELAEAEQSPPGSPFHGEFGKFKASPFVERTPSTTSSATSAAASAVEEKKES